jgi:hypothetical protein
MYMCPIFLDNVSTKLNRFVVFIATTTKILRLGRIQHIITINGSPYDLIATKNKIKQKNTDTRQNADVSENITTQFPRLFVHERGLVGEH